MKHLTEEELIGHRYGEDEPGVTRHLEECGQCAEAYAALRRDLAQLKAVEPPARSALYGEQVWRSLSNSLPVYAMQKRIWRRMALWSSLGYAAACALLVAGAFVAGRHWEHRKSPITAANDSRTKQQVVLVVLGDHLDRSERLLVELKHADASSGDMASPMQEEARKLLASNRACQQNVAQIDDPALAASLDRLGRVLAEMANEPGGLSNSTIARLQREVSIDGLLFEVRVLRTRVPERPGKAVQPNGGTI
jgi:hypothetical protein